MKTPPWVRTIRSVMKPPPPWIGSAMNPATLAQVELLTSSSEIPRAFHFARGIGEAERQRWQYASCGVHDAGLRQAEPATASVSVIDGGGAAMINVAEHHDPGVSRETNAPTGYRFRWPRCHHW